MHEKGSPLNGTNTSLRGSFSTKTGVICGDLVMEVVIQVRHLSKFFKEIKAIDDISFSVERGEIYGFLGQNGAGKSTAIRMLLSLIEPTAGTIEIFGKDPAMFLQKSFNLL